MATRTFGTNAQTTLTALPFPNAPSGTRMQDFGAICALIKDDVPGLWAQGNAGTANDQNATQRAAFQAVINTSFVPEGRLYIPNRGVLTILPGDWVAVDGFGWPILVSGRSVQSATPSASWIHTGNPT